MALLSYVGQVLNLTGSAITTDFTYSNSVAGAAQALTLLCNVQFASTDSGAISVQLEGTIRASGYPMALLQLSRQDQDAGQYSTVVFNPSEGLQQTVLLLTTSAGYIDLWKVGASSASGGVSGDTVQISATESIDQWS